MAQFSVEIADSDVLRVLDAIAANYGRQDMTDNPNYNPLDNSQPLLIANPETKAQFANRKVREFLSENVKAYEIRVAKEQAAATAALNSQISISDPQV